jgi:hypothetical protein
LRVRTKVGNWLREGAELPRSRTPCAAGLQKRFIACDRRDKQSSLDTGRRPLVAKDQSPFASH